MSVAADLSSDTIPQEPERAAGDRRRARGVPGDRARHDAAAERGVARDSVVVIASLMITIYPRTANYPHPISPCLVHGLIRYV